MLRYVPSVPTFWRGFFKIINGCWILKKAFSAWLSYGFYCMKCVNVVLSHWFADIEKCLYLWDKYQLHMVYWSFKCIAEFGLLVFCWGFLLLCSSVILACNFLFFCYGFGIRVMLASLNEVGSVPSSAMFWNSFRRIGVNYFLNVW